MTLADLDWRILRGSLIGLAVCLLVGGAVVYVSYQYSSAQELEFRNESRKLLTVRGRYQTIDEEERIIEEFLPRFLALEDRGVIGREYRLDWIETLRNASDELKLPELTYTIDTQSLYEAEIPFEEGAFQIFVSAMKLDLGLLHEGDLPALIARIERDARGLFRVADCSLTRAGAELAFDPTRPNLRANCTLEWLTVRQPDPEQPA